jgi:hypothetical protein
MLVAMVLLLVVVMMVAMVLETLTQFPFQQASPPFV